MTRTGAWEKFEKRTHAATHAREKLDILAPSLQEKSGDGQHVSYLGTAWKKTSSRRQVNERDTTALPTKKVRALRKLVGGGGGGLQGFAKP